MNFIGDIAIPYSFSRSFVFFVFDKLLEVENENERIEFPFAHAQV